jgi:endonuclease YncB( thermonuclease family)
MTRYWFALLVMLAPSLTLAYTMSGRVIRVDNGNTVTIVDANNVQHTVRLQDIQAPGINRPEGVKAWNRLQELVAGRHVTIEYPPQTGYWSPTGRVYLGDEDVNLKQIQEGMARYRPSGTPADKKREERYRQAQQRAMVKRKGVWYELSPAQPSPPPAAGPQTRALPPRGEYAPLSARPRYVYRPAPPVVLPGEATRSTHYPPLPDRDRVAYGGWGPGPQAMSGASVYPPLPKAIPGPGGPVGPATGAVPVNPYWSPWARPPAPGR